ncbi:MAG: DNA oxidative demethylase AlkB [Thermomonas sp.]|uniref:DNA oxidative demethylase AlkB n=1 Tax=Thermomonas sp. TaxID=1971895 RepID=UPI001EB52C11|nr:DNA oxidative demethylase AlkB [Thermomonas sp.]MBV2209850.1 DNA oxidative demethylase AlkB [Thermomonas sp.]
MSDLFAGPLAGQRTALGPQACVLHGFALPYVTQLLQGINDVTAHAPFRNLTTPGGHVMQVAMTNCGPLGWVSDRRGYRYAALDPQTQVPWPAFPNGFLALAEAAAAAAGLPQHRPDACLINRYLPGTRLSLHQDRDEDDAQAPIVSVSLGLPATFLWGGMARADKTLRVPVAHGDVVVWGGADRMRFHGVLPVPPGRHPIVGEQRLNLTFRKVR